MYLWAGILCIQCVKELPSVAVQILQIQMQYIQMPGRVRLRDLLLQDQFRHVCEGFVVAFADFLSAFLKSRKLL